MTSFYRYKLNPLLRRLLASISTNHHLKGKGRHFSHENNTKRGIDAFLLITGVLFKQFTTSTGSSGWYLSNERDTKGVIDTASQLSSVFVYYPLVPLAVDVPVQERVGANNPSSDEFNFYAKVSLFEGKNKPPCLKEVNGIDDFSCERDKALMQMRMFSTIHAHT